MNCRFCKNYDSTGRHGGYCNLLSVAVQGKWEACRCFSSKFSENSLPEIDLPEIEKSKSNSNFVLEAIAN
ncbi:hypothetical protein [Pseudanabaena sp. lw0831]|uniref:hypothetical protein n=1 Tax=Pseudanabaena sp. lw0831 TaxID=1357935 RepID=UPI001915397D|nr:hypothetical protein [Pseudanabaena sp. lw0831]